MAEYIEKNVAIARLTALEIGNPCATMTDAKRQIADTRPADVAPVVHGRWIDDGSGIIICPECERGYNLHAKYTHYCPNCGAKMDIENGGDGDEAD